MSHQCPGNGCATLVDGGKLMCAGCWRQVPGPLQKAVYAAWGKGRGALSPAHRAAMKAAIRAVNGEAEPAAADGT